MTPRAARNHPAGKNPSKSKRTSDAAIAVGILIPVIIIIVIAIVIFLILRRKRKTQSETVSFENPNYGRGKVMINGLEEQEGFDYSRLQESNSREYNTLQPSGNMYDNFGTNGAAATLPVDTEEINPNVTHRESSEI
ncbi:hypothetical protein LOTGIDRAFT_171747 [Lottia gigantea]|uniref:Uncharacterized protein n=1 Tax=Lottia gigantea TaxID=225164 RepID=V4CLG8_LOTGI|nr:hypothetical protein LOTGIDRAFT_171747 [Lottia gigantea]ESP03140.1 hypothetical protein LOTGIDRAFT_171747 [Lottia gigantea]